MRAVWARLKVLVLLICVLVTLVGSKHSNNWAVIVGASRYWFNYRHNSNALAVYHTVKSLGIPDSQIILMLADDFACNPRNPWKASMTAAIGDSHGVYDQSIEVDYRGLECNVENLLRLLTNRKTDSSHGLSDEIESRKLNTDKDSNILIYMSGHGGDTFLKFHDKQEIQSGDFAEAFEMMHLQKRFHRILFITDTCQASTLSSLIRTVNVMSLGSSDKDESSYSYSSDPRLGVTVVDRFTRELVLYFLTHSSDISDQTIHSMMKTVNQFSKLSAHAIMDYGKDSSENTNTDSHISSISEPIGQQTRLVDFFAAQTDVLLWNDTISLSLQSHQSLGMNNQEEIVESPIRTGGIIKMSDETRELFGNL